MRIGVISDTHGLLRPEALAALAGVDHIVHAGDIGGVRILVTHILPRPHAPERSVRDAIRREPADVVVFGHSHLPHDEVIDGVRYYPVSVGIIERDRAYHVALDDRSIPALEKRMNQLSR
jgi:predicted phosphodiesterase